LSLLPLVADPDRINGPRHFAYAEIFDPSGPGPYDRNNRAIRDQRWKLIRTFRAKRTPATQDEFYDLDIAPAGTDGENLCPCPGNLSDEALAAFERLVTALEELSGP
jgi:hypothetical protein